MILTKSSGSVELMNRYFQDRGWQGNFCRIQVEEWRHSSSFVQSWGFKNLDKHCECIKWRIDLQIANLRYPKWPFQFWYNFQQKNISNTSFTKCIEHDWSCLLPMLMSASPFAISWTAAVKLKNEYNFISSDVRINVKILSAKSKMTVPAAWM